MPWVDGKWIEEDSSVASKMTGLLGSDSSYIKQARSGGVRTAAKRGLLNSSIAAGSGESAAIAAAQPIAAQDAATAAGRNEQAQGFEYSTKLNDQQITGQKSLAELNNAAETARQKEAQGFQLTTQERDNIAQAARQKDQIAASDRQALLASDTNIATAKINSMDNISSNYLNALSNLTANSKLKAADRNAYIAEFQKVMKSAQALAGSVGSITTSW